MSRKISNLMSLIKVGVHGRVPKQEKKNHYCAGKGSVKNRKVMDITSKKKPNRKLLEKKKSQNKKFL